MRDSAERPVAAAGLIVAALGTIVMVSWHLRLDAVLQVSPGLAPMQYNAAAGFVLTGSALFAAARGWRWFAHVAAGVTALLAGLTAVQYAAGVDLGIDELVLTSHLTDETSHPGRMAPNTVAGFLLVSGAIVLASRRALSSIGAIGLVVLSSLPASLGAVALFGYVFGVEPAYGWGDLTRMALLTATGFLILGAASSSVAQVRAGRSAATVAAVLTFVVGTTVSALLWQALREHDTAVAGAGLPSQRFGLPELTLAGGVFASGLIAITIRLAVRSRAREREARQAARALALEYELIEQLLAAIPSILISVDQEGRVILWNGAAESILGVPATVAVGTPLRSLNIGWRAETLVDAVEACLATSKPQHLDRIPLETEAATRVLACTVHLMRDAAIDEDADGLAEDRPGPHHRGRCLIIGADITERSRLQEQLQQAQKLESIGQLAAGLAHEINTPAQYVSDNIDFLTEAFDLLQPALLTLQERDPRSIVPVADGDDQYAELQYLLEEIPKALTQSSEGLERVTSIVLAMRSYSHPGSEGFEFVDLNDLLKDTGVITRNEWKHEATLSYELSDLPPVQCSRGEIAQVFVNLMVNASHAIEEAVEQGKPGPHGITVRSAVAGRRAEVRISDTGAGIPRDVQRRIFDPFFTTKDVGHGTGQGLSLARLTVVDRHRGELTFESTPGAGTTFVVRLPFEQPREQPREQAA